MFLPREVESQGTGQAPEATQTVHGMPWGKGRWEQAAVDCAALLMLRCHERRRDILMITPRPQQSGHEECPKAWREGSGLLPSRSAFSRAGAARGGVTAILGVGAFVVTVGLATMTALGSERVSISHVLFDEVQELLPGESRTVVVVAVGGLRLLLLPLTTGARLATTATVTVVVTVVVMNGVHLLNSVGSTVGRERHGSERRRREHRRDRCDGGEGGHTSVVGKHCDVRFTLLDGGESTEGGEEVRVGGALGGKEVLRRSTIDASQMSSIPEAEVELKDALVRKRREGRKLLESRIALPGEEEGGVAHAQQSPIVRRDHLTT